MDEKEIEALAHRMAWRYAKSQDPHHSDTYTFNRYCLLQFVDELLLAKARVTAAPAKAVAYRALKTGALMDAAEVEALWPSEQARANAVLAPLVYAAPAPAPLTDEQIDAGIAAWFKTDISTNGGKDRGHPFRQRMRAAINAARAQAQKGE